jgi:gas vesicle protein
MTHPGYRPEDQQHIPPQSPAYPGYPPPQPTGSWPAASPPPYAVSGAPPSTGVPYGQQQQPPPSGGRTPMLVAVVAAVALFLLAGVMTGLYVAKSSQLGDARDTVSSRDEAIKTNTDRITKLEADLKTANDELTKNKETLDKTTKERDVLLPCMRRFTEAVDAADADNDAALSTALRQATTACEKARTEIGE